jgi:hypothetical protein
MIPTSFVKTVTPEELDGEQFERVRYQHPDGFMGEYLIQVDASPDERFNYEYSLETAFRRLLKSKLESLYI